METAAGIFQRVLNFYATIDAEKIRVEHFGFGIRIFLPKMDRKAKWPRLTRKKVCNT